MALVTSEYESLSIEFGRHLLNSSVRPARGLDHTPSVDDSPTCGLSRIPTASVSAIPAESHDASASSVTFTKSRTARSGHVAGCRLRSWAASWW